MLSKTILKDAKSQPQTLMYRIDNRLAGLDEQDEALEDPETAYLFALRIPGADIEKCQRAACLDPEWAYEFVIDVPGANIRMSQIACQGTIFASMILEAFVWREKSRQQ